MAIDAERIRIRRARPSEASVLTDIAHQAKRFWGYPDEFIQLWRDALTLTPVTLQSCDTFVATEAGRIRGFVALERLDRSTLEIQHLWVLPESMRRHIGRLLWERAVQWCHEQGARRIEVDSDPHAEGFYARMGMQRIGTTPSIPVGRQLPRLRWQDPSPESPAPHA